jgi:tRNA(Ile)-lysidine synthase
MKRLTAFLNLHWDKERPLALGFSGGPDSKALLYALLEAGVDKLHLAHVDHGWREESGAEAARLQTEAEKLGLTFHTVRLEKPEGGNWEDASRKKRLAFFRSVYEKTGAAALLLAHTANDLAETVLKRLLEGAHLANFRGMEKVSQFEGMVIWRPFLDVKKEELLRFLEERGLKPLIDPSNVDPSYLRARMRMETLPWLAKSFGKEILDNLNLLSSRSSELKSYLDRQIEGIPISKGPWGSFAELGGLDRIIARHFLQRWLGSLSRGVLESILDALGEPNRAITREIYVDRGIVFHLSGFKPKMGEPLPIAVGRSLWGSWEIEVERAEGPLMEPTWKDVWTGAFSAPIEGGILTTLPEGSSIRDDWSSKKVPALFRSEAPVLIDASGLVKEFLMGRGGGRALFKLSAKILDPTA